MCALPVPWCHSALRQSGAESTLSGFCSGGLRCSLPGHRVAAPVMRFVKVAGSFAGNSNGGKEHAGRKQSLHHDSWGWSQNSACPTCVNSKTVRECFENV